MPPLRCLLPIRLIHADVALLYTFILRQRYFDYCFFIAAADFRRHAMILPLIRHLRHVVRLFRALIFSVYCRYYFRAFSPLFCRQPLLSPLFHRHAADTAAAAAYADAFRHDDAAADAAFAAAFATPQFSPLFFRHFHALFRGMARGILYY